MHHRHFARNVAHSSRALAALLLCMTLPLTACHHDRTPEPSPSADMRPVPEDKAPKRPAPLTPPPPPIPGHTSR